MKLDLKQKNKYMTDKELKRWGALEESQRILAEVQFMNQILGYVSMSELIKILGKIHPDENK